MRGHGPCPYNAESSASSRRGRLSRPPRRALLAQSGARHSARDEAEEEEEEEEDADDADADDEADYSPSSAVVDFLPYATPSGTKAMPITIQERMQLMNAKRKASGLCELRRNESWYEVKSPDASTGVSTTDRAKGRLETSTIWSGVLPAFA